MAACIPPVALVLGQGLPRTTLLQCPEVVIPRTVAALQLPPLLPSTIFAPVLNVVVIFVVSVVAALAEPLPASSSFFVVCGQKAGVVDQSRVDRGRGRKQKFGWTSLVALVSEKPGTSPHPSQPH